MSSLKHCLEFLDEASPEGLEVHALAPNSETSRTLYPDTPCFLEDGRRVILQVDGKLNVCHLDEGAALQPLVDNISCSNGCLAANGRYLIYRQGEYKPGELTYHRLDLRTGQSEEVFSANGTIPGTSCPVSQCFSETVSYDGSRIAALAYLDYEIKPAGETGIVVMDTETQEMNVICSLPHTLSHLRYSPSSSNPQCRQLMVQHQHDRLPDKKGVRIPRLWQPGDRGVDLHILQDDGTHWCDLPFGRDGVETCIGHQLWRGSRNEVTAIMLQTDDNSFGWADGTRQHVVTGCPVPADPRKDHVGRCGREEHRHLLSHEMANSRLCHLGMDQTGLRFAFDTFPIWTGRRAGMAIYIGQGQTLSSPLKFQYLFNSGNVLNSPHPHDHAHPILSPDGCDLLFTSSLHGQKQAYIVKNLPWPYSEASSSKNIETEKY